MSLTEKQLMRMSFADIGRLRFVVDADTKPLVDKVYDVKLEARKRRGFGSNQELAKQYGGKKGEGKNSTKSQNVIAG